MIGLLGYALLGLVAALLLGLARGSMRRLVATGAFGLLLAFVAFPLSRSVGYLTRQTIDPTPLGLLPVFPWWGLVPLLLLAVLWALNRGGRLLGGMALLSGVAILGLSFYWFSADPILSRVQPVNGLMEGVAGVVVASLVALLAGRRRRWLGLGLGIVVGLGLFLWMMNPGQGQTYLPNTQGYYRLLVPAPAGTEAQLVQQYNADLPALNAIRVEIGFDPLEPISSLRGLEGGRIPEAVADQGYRLLTPGQAQYGAFALLSLAGLLLGAGLMLLRQPSLQEAGDLRLGLVLAGVFSVLLPAFDATQFALSRLVEGREFFGKFLEGMWPPNLVQLDPSNPERSLFPLQEVLSQMALTIEIALVGTFLAAIFAIPSSFLAARNLTQGSRAMRAVFGLMRTFYNVDRGVDTLILALVFVAAVGLGPFAGVLAMAIHSIADLGKLYSEAIENVERGPIEALEATGATGSNVVRWAILPQVLPLFVSYTLYRFEINFRVSIILGFVGAGGIGFFIQGAMAAGHYDQMIIGVLAIVLVVNLIDFASSWLRSRLV